MKFKKGMGRKYFNKYIELYPDFPRDEDGVIDMKKSNEQLTEFENKIKKGEIKL